MKTKRPELVISFAGVIGHTRRVLSENIQRNLFRAGYQWPTGGATPQELDAEILHVNSPNWNPTHITFEREGPVKTDYACVVYHAATQSVAFLAAARDALVEKRNIQGVDVTITPIEVKLDATGLLSAVSSAATAIQRELFQRG